MNNIIKLAGNKRTHKRTIYIKDNGEWMDHMKVRLLTGELYPASYGEYESYRLHSDKPIADEVVNELLRQGKPEGV